MGWEEGKLSSFIKKGNLLLEISRDSEPKVLNSFYLLEKALATGLVGERWQNH